MNAQEISKTIRNLNNPAKDLDREVYPEARTLRALGVDIPKEVADRRPIARTARWMVQVLLARLEQIDPKEAAKFFAFREAQLPKNPVQLDSPIEVSEPVESED